MGTLYRELAVRLAIKEAEKGVREQGWNTGPDVRKYQRADGLVLDTDTGYPWCASFVVWCFETVGRPLVELHESASVGYLLQFAGQHGWRVANPARGDMVCFFWGSDNWPDHVGIVTGVAPGKILTVEGNTSSDSSGSQDEGDGVFKKTRDLAKNRVAYIRVPGEDSAPDLHDYVLSRGRPGNERVVAVADTPEQAGKVVAAQLKAGAWGIRARKRKET